MTSSATSTQQAPARHPVVGAGDGLRLLGRGADPLTGVGITAVHPAGDVLWALAGRQDLYRVDRAGASMAARLSEGPVATCVFEHAGEVWVGGDEAGLWRLEGHELEPVASFHDAPTSDEWSTPWGGPPSVFSMAAHGDDLYVSVHVGGIMATADGGRTWRPTIDLKVDVHQVAVDASGGVWAATGMRGLAHSTDRGATWRFHDRGLHADYLLAVAPTGDGVLVAASSHHGARDGAVYRFDGERFERCADLPRDLAGAVPPHHLAADGDAAVVALPDGDVYASADGGRRWSRIAEAVPVVHEVALVP